MGSVCLLEWWNGRTACLMIAWLGLGRLVHAVAMLVVAGCTAIFSAEDEIKSQPHMFSLGGGWGLLVSSAGGRVALLL